MKRLVRDLSDTFFNAKTKYHYCRGIAAPQIGSLKRAILIDDSRFKGPLINPRVISASGPTHEVWDSCLSFNLAFFLQVDRHNSVQIEFLNEEGIKDVLQADGILSELLQHEIDHLDGILATDRLKDIRKIIMREEYEKMSRHTRLGTQQSPGRARAIQSPYFIEATLNSPPTQCPRSGRNGRLPSKLLDSRHA